ncbi:hypothetical protein IV102_20205, partial [bacterium]|nr:hypothetical protein [bacterium]
NRVSVVYILSNQAYPGARATISYHFSSQFAIELDAKSATVRCSQTLGSEERVCLVLPFGGQSLTPSASTSWALTDVLKFKVMTMKAGQKKRFEEYLSQR